MSFTIEAVREAPVEAAAVFRLYADPSTWVTWGHNATRVRADGPLAPGSTVYVRANYGREYPCRVIRFETDRALALEVRPPLLRIVNVYEVTPSGQGVRVRHAFEVSGPLARVTRWIGLDRVYRRQLAAEVAKVIELAARQPVGDAPSLSLDQPR